MGQEITQILLDAGACDENTKLTARELGDRLGISRTTVFNMVELERLHGVPICSTSRKGGGYYLPDTKAEAGRAAVKACYLGLKQRAARMSKTATWLLDTIQDEVM